MSTGLAETNTNLEMKLGIERGALAETYNKFDPNTLQHSRELMNSRRLHPDQDVRQDLRNRWFYTADFSLYKVEDGEAVLYFADRENNLIFQDIEEATRQLIDNDNYIPSKDGIERVVKAKSTLRVKLSDLDLKGDNEEWRYFEIDTENPEELNSSQRAFAERIYGTGDDFRENMAMLKQEGRSRTRVYVLNPDYVENNVDEDSPALARACWLSYFSNNSYFGAVNRNVFDINGSLRGVHLIGEADSQKINDVHSLYEKPIVQERAAEMLTPQQAVGLARTLALYTARQVNQ